MISVFTYVKDFCTDYYSKNYVESFAKMPNIVADREMFQCFPPIYWDDLFLFLFPPRTKSDIGIRNIRLTDALEISDELGKTSSF